MLTLWGLTLGQVGGHDERGWGLYGSILLLPLPLFFRTARLKGEEGGGVEDASNPLIK